MSFWVKHYKLYKMLKKMGFRDPRYLLTSPHSPDLKKSIKWIKENEITDFGGFKMKLSANSSQDLWYNAFRMEGSSYEQETISLLKANIKKTDTFIDIGSNSGYFSLSLAGLCNKVISFEPIPDAYKRLKTNIKINRFSNIKTFNVALTDKQKETTFWIDQNNDGESSLDYEGTFKQSGMPITVQTNTLDNILNEDKVDIIKLDAEGFESEILKGGRKTIEKVRLIVFEQNLNIFEKKDKYIDKNIIIKFLDAHGFSIRTINNNGSLGNEIHDYTEATGIYSNLCAIRRLG